MAVITLPYQFRTFNHARSHVRSLTISYSPLLDFRRIYSHRIIPSRLSPESFLWCNRRSRIFWRLFNLSPESFHFAFAGAAVPYARDEIYYTGS
ncbi:hypothetical protein D9611_009984 [Ephemerocybe angulata]|uniref:Uncharacterized protein n=1 Tax=Ephemerocybe angulata TaxID=980116 RepID=A0A8H5FFS1_9AGAR|nr:hypothetical protein D9611_009984 [Tulosesus angulatus]